MVRTKADHVPGTYRKVVVSRAPRKVLGSSTFVTSSSSCSSRKAENKYAGGNPVCVRPTPKWQKGIGEFFRLSPRDSEKENRVPEEAGCSGLGTAKRNTSGPTYYETDAPDANTVESSSSSLKAITSILGVLLTFLCLIH